MSMLSQRIKELRLKRNKTLLEVAEAIGVREATLQRYESGKIKNIPYEKIQAIAEYLNCTPSYLMGWSDEFNNQSSLHSDLINIVSSLSEDQAKAALDYINYLKSKDN